MENYQSKHLRDQNEGKRRGVGGATTVTTTYEV